MSAPRVHPFVRRAAFLLAALLIALLVAEWVFRAAVATGVVAADIWPLVDADVDGAIHRYSDDPRLVYECRPGASTSKDGVTLRVNSAGFRGPEPSAVKAPGVKRVAIVGDSVTFAAEVAEERTFVARAADLLRADGSAPRCEVLNFGVTGYNSDQELALLETRVLPLEPDLVVVAYCMNDLSPTDGLGALSIASHPGSWGRRLRSHLVIYLSDQAARRSSWGNRSFDRPARLFDRVGALQTDGRTAGLVVAFPQLDESRREWNRPEEYDRACALARAAGLDVIDVRAEMRDVPTDGRAALYSDRTHFSEAGHEFVGRLVADAVRRALAGK